MAEFARRVHNRLAAEDNLQQAYIDARAALMAVVDECEQMRTLSDLNAPIRWAITDRIESAIARELGIPTEETS